jgi:electron transport complex protein RnfG
MKVLEEKETPGLGDRIEKDTAFVGGFAGALTPLKGVKRGQSKEPSDVDMITGATISSRTVIRAINKTLDRLRPALAARLQEAAP